MHGLDKNRFEGNDDFLHQYNYPGVEKETVEYVRKMRDAGLTVKYITSPTNLIWKDGDNHCVQAMARNVTTLDIATLPKDVTYYVLLVEDRATYDPITNQQSITTVLRYGTLPNTNSNKETQPND